MSRAKNPNSLRQTAARLNIPYWAYQKYMANKCVPLSCAKVLAKRLNVPLESIKIKKREVQKIHKKRPKISEHEFARRWNADPKNRMMILTEAEMKYDVELGR